MATTSRAAKSRTFLVANVRDRPCAVAAMSASRGATMRPWDAACPRARPADSAIASSTAITLPLNLALTDSIQAVRRSRREEFAIRAAPKLSSCRVMTLSQRWLFLSKEFQDVRIGRRSDEFGYDVRVDQEFGHSAGPSPPGRKDRRGG